MQIPGCTNIYVNRVQWREQINNKQKKQTNESTLFVNQHCTGDVKSGLAVFMLKGLTCSKIMSIYIVV